MLTRQEVLDHFGKHLVSLFWFEQPSRDRIEGEPFIGSAFVVQEKKRWFLITAGHVVGSLQRAAEEHRLKLCIFFDFFSGDARSRELLPLDFENAGAWTIGNEDDIDYGIIPIRPLLKTALEYNGIEPIAEEARSHPRNFDSFYLLGTPGESVKTKTDRKGIHWPVSASSMMIRLYPDDNPPDELVKATPRMYFRIPVGERDIGGETLAHPKGMSGGVIVGVRHGTKLSRYWPLAVQSGYHSPSKTIAACPLSDVSKIIRKPPMRLLENLASKC